MIGPTVVIEEAENVFSFSARVDTATTTTSSHVEDYQIEGEAGEMTKSVGKTICLRMKNQRGES